MLLRSGLASLPPGICGVKENGNGGAGHTYGCPANGSFLPMATCGLQVTGDAAAAAGSGLADTGDRQLEECLAGFKHLRGFEIISFLFIKSE